MLYKYYWIFATVCIYTSKIIFLNTPNFKNASFDLAQFINKLSCWYQFYQMLLLLLTDVQTVSDWWICILKIDHEFVAKVVRS